MAILIFIILIPVTFFLGDFYHKFIWLILPANLQLGTYLGNTAFITLGLTSLIVVIVSAILFYFLRNKLINKLKSELIILGIIWIVVLLILMNPFIITIFNF